MIRNEREYHNARKQAERLKAESEKLEGDERAPAVRIALQMQIGDIEREIIEYERLKRGETFDFEAQSLDELGEVLTKARIARGLSQAGLAEELGMEPQQVQRYERDGWQKISVWRLQEVIEALGLRLGIHAEIGDPVQERVSPRRN